MPFSSKRTKTPQRSRELENGTGNVQEDSRTVYQTKNQTESKTADDRYKGFETQVEKVFSQPNTGTNRESVKTITAMD